MKTHIKGTKKTLSLTKEQQIEVSELLQRYNLKEMSIESLVYLAFELGYSAASTKEEAKVCSLVKPIDGKMMKEIWKKEGLLDGPFM